MVDKGYDRICDRYEYIGINPWGGLDPSGTSPDDDDDFPVTESGRPRS